jgi:signal transduction histidine kinase
MITLIKNIFVSTVSFGVYPGMEDDKKIVIQIASFDGIATLLSFVAYVFLYFDHKWLFWCHLIATLTCLIGIFLLSKRRYDFGRYLIFSIGLIEMFINVDALSTKSGFEFYYLAPIVVPFFVFTPKEYKKSITLSFIGFTVFIIQQIIGHGHFSEVQEATSEDRIITLSIIFIYIFGLFSISRWQFNKIQNKVVAQEEELINVSNIAVLGEISGGIAHEINNPLQILMAQINQTKKIVNQTENIPTKVLENLEKMEAVTNRISKIVRGLKNLSRKVENDPYSVFTIKDAIDDMQVVIAGKLVNSSVLLTISGNDKIKIRGHLVQVSQVLMNLVGNSIDAIEDLSEKWIKVEIREYESIVSISVVDSGKGIPTSIADRIMNPFYTTKQVGKGTGLGLSLSKSMIEKMGGRLFYDDSSPNTKFVIELSLVKM